LGAYVPTTATTVVQLQHLVGAAVRLGLLLLCCPFGQGLDGHAPRHEPVQHPHAQRVHVFLQVTAWDVQKVSAMRCSPPARPRALCCACGVLTCLLEVEWPAASL
jgi:hypothetical protein